MKTLIINGSPRLNGDTAALLDVLRRNLAGGITEISAYRDDIHPCVDCRACETKPGCVIRDDMDVVFGDYDNVVVASPVYYGIFPGPLVSLMSRFQFYRSAEHVLKTPITVTPKNGAALLTAGGKDNLGGAHRLSRVLLRMLGATLTDENTILSDNTDAIPARDDEAAATRIRELAERWNAAL
ncbi:MAG: flavodoxin family protein [Oscillospiraceae bacterium]|jgi:multimeric flavodoxin WrbA|nr:flavodoxin family protein [Oscillospiraceae bacterium]